MSRQPSQYPRDLAGYGRNPPDPRWGAPRAAGAGYDRIADVVRDSIDLPAVAKLVGLAW